MNMGKEKRKGFSNNSNLLGIVILIVFGVFIFFDQKRRHEKFSSLEAHKGITEAVTYDCFKNVKSSLPTVKYRFNYKGTVYAGTKDFDKSRRGNICDGFKFLVEFDTTDPTISLINLDSLKYSPH
ncbi:hypothetical protein [Pinibacter aurantiacus]|uniref:Uncharacterized protein n=1 Tax=Pinibacter aurantiacus TaxID=2851599 RepID=A0A9E2W8Z6_9BACT|nr:hypothetical protein [Pinibacter aurantiacus]MBV4358937.1 hypothetical protein [Pinibacter aurantiacus]